MKCLRAAGLVIGALAAGGCSGLVAARTFAPIGDHEPSIEPGLDDAGHTPWLVPPPGVTWTLAVIGYDDAGRTAGGARHYAFELALTDADAHVTGWRLTPRTDGAYVADDEGNQFPCTRIVLPEPPKESRKDLLPTRTYTLQFAVPPGYRFRQIGNVAIHWSLALDGGVPVPITSRFRAL